MRILFLSHYAPPHAGGIEVVISELAAELRRRGHEVRWVASAAVRHGEELAGEELGGIVRVPALNVLEDRLGVPWPVFSPRLAGVLAREVAWADVVHGHGCLYLSTVGGLVRARRGGPAQAPVRVLTEHVGHVAYTSRVLDAVQRGAFATLGALAIRAAQAVIVLNPKVAAELAPVVGRRPLLTIANGIDSERFRPPADDVERRALRAELGWDERPRAVFVGRIVAKKGIDVLLAAASAAGGAYRTVIVGPGELPGPPGEHVDVLGSRSRDDVARIVRAADAFVLPSRGEGFPVTVQEALASGVPVFLRDDPAYAAYVDPERLAVRLVPAEGAALAGAVRALVEDPEERRRAGAAARAHALERFSWRRAADEHLALYARLGDSAT